MNFYDYDQTDIDDDDIQSDSLYRFIFQLSFLSYPNYFDILIFLPFEGSMNYLTDQN